MRITSQLFDPLRNTRRLLSALCASVVAVLAGTAAAAPAAAIPVALVVWVEGDVQTGRSPLPPHHIVAVGDSVVLAKGSKVALLYPQQARLWTVHGPGQVRVAASAPTPLDKRVRVESRALPAVYREVEVGSASVAQGALVLRGATPLRIAGPRIGLWFEPQGELQWSAPAWARKFDVEVSRAEGTVVQKHATEEPRLLIAHLQPGAAYTVRVEVLNPDGRRHSDSIRFSVVEEQRARDLLAARPAADADLPARAAYEALLAAIAAAPWR